MSQHSAATDDVGSSASGLTDPEELFRRHVMMGMVGVWLCGAILSIYTLYIGRNLFVPIFVGVFAYLTLRPVVRAASRLGVPPSVSAAGVMLGLVIAIGMAFYTVSGPAKELIEGAPKTLSVAKEKLGFVLERIQTVNEATEELTDSSGDEAAPADKPVPVEIKQPAWTTNYSIVAGTGNFVSFVSIAGVLLYFLMAAGDQLLRSIMTALPTFRSKRRFLEIVENIQDGLSSYLAQVTAINIGLGVAVAFVMWLLGVPSPLLWGIVAMTFNFIPIVGAICGVAILFLVSLVHFDQTYYAFVVAGAYALLTALEGQFVTPWILGRSMQMSSVMVFLSIVIWGWMWGMMGVFLAVPILIAVTMISQKCEAMAPLSTLLGGTAERVTTEGQSV
ncbi:MAG: AI-2E family transporter [Pirellulaceae bacterium]|nr:AI-2E family transporter [Pirellulaceae bacterium]